MSRILLIATVTLTVLFLAIGVLFAGGSDKGTPKTPEGTVQAMFADVKAKNWGQAYSFVENTNNTDLNSFVADLNGANGDLRTFSSLANVKTRVLHATDNDALVHTDMQWSTAVGAIYDSLDLQVVNNSGSWKVVWPVQKQPNVPPQVIPVNFLRWDIVTRGAGDDWGAQNVEAPHVRIVSMNAVEYEGGTVIVGEVVNEDTVPGFVSVSASLLGKNGGTLGDESSFDKISHVLLPKEVSPFRIDFPKVPLREVKNVHIQPNSLLVPAAADPTIGVLHQRLEQDSGGHRVLRGELTNEGGQTVNIPHVLATFYDNQGRVIWVSDGYVDHALLPQTPVPFSLALRDDIAPKVQTYRVSVNQYSINRQPS